MGTGYLNSQRLYQELDQECEELAREYGHVTAAQRNEILARLMEEARNNPPVKVSLTTVGPHGT